MISSNSVPCFPGVFDLKTRSTSPSRVAASGGPRDWASRINRLKVTEPPVTLELKSAASMSFAMKGVAAIRSASP
eukprot:CAMPEP_0172793184 /NCGR_PEP_ID=MMETSP1074-20121228/209352_1 /TAXON_ID=2916 /ORGANISM="Ceratium fusus, Strain PA161109" /LENGTH=74 /DNA_ID=CAMNT_0013630259 /DNA_START=157 /DNA_END=381 /DNA_ORIENTATION=+